MLEIKLSILTENPKIHLMTVSYLSKKGSIPVNAKT